MKRIKFQEAKSKYKTTRVGVILSEDKEEFIACYCKTEDIKDATIQVNSFNKKEYQVESYTKEQVDRIFELAMINIDREIDSLFFDMEDLKSERSKTKKILKQIEVSK